MSGGLIDKVYIGLDNAPAAFDIKGRILGPVSFPVLLILITRVMLKLFIYKFLFPECYKFRIH